MKTVVILSTEAWGNMMLSKMHFASEMARAGDRVFFVNPPSAEKITAEAHVIGEAEGVVLVRFPQIPARRFLRNKLFWLYQVLIRRYVSTILSITGPIDELWCFDPNTYCDLRRFRAKRTLLLLYDFYKGRPVDRAVRSAELLVSVSHLILNSYQHFRVPELFVQHGLSRHFEEKSIKKLEALNPDGSSDKIKIGYVGNLLREGMCIEVMKQIILEHRDKEFHFWGAYMPAGNNLMSGQYPASEDSLAFVQFLLAQDHVRLHGPVDQQQLAAGMFAMDAFLFVYSYEKDLNKASNAHKLMEYLSTGKVIVATFVSNYQNTKLLCMVPAGEEQTLPELFSEVLLKLAKYNDRGLQSARIRFALDNTYSNQVEKIRAALPN